MLKKIISIGLICGLLQSALAQSIGSLYADIKASEVGDVLTVIIVESANASRESKSKSQSKAEMQAGASASGNLADFLPLFGGGSNISSNYAGSDGTEQRDRLTGRITVRIVEKTESGMFKIKGERKLGVNSEENLMQLEGYVRPKDINTDNSIFSYNIADAKITYRKSGITNKLLGQGTLSKTFTWIVGGLMIAAGAGYFAFK